jgi:hypothetical protein
MILKRKAHIDKRNCFEREGEILTREDGYNLSFLVETIPGATKGEDRVSESCLNLLVIFIVCFLSELDGRY